MVPDSPSADQWAVHFWTTSMVTSPRSMYYYGPDAPVTPAILDLASDGETRTVDELARLVGAVELDPRPTRDALTQVVEAIAADHYLGVVPGHLPPAYGFSSDLLRRAWRAMRHLP